MVAMDADRIETGFGKPMHLLREFGGGARLLRVIVVKFYEIAEGYRKFHVLIGIEGVEAERVFETRHDQRETERIKARL